MKNNSIWNYVRLFSICYSIIASLLLAGSAAAVQFSFLDPAYTQQIYAGPNVGLPGAWTSTGELLARRERAGYP